ncbi:MAG: UDP-3-O-acyl-N-acetylglucosamine deacetylase [Acidobacteriota bacterium]
MSRRTTIARSLETRGTGLHSGKRIRLRLEPAAPGAGLVFVRTDRDGVEIPATVDHLADLAYATTVAAAGVSVGTVEHLLSAVAGLGIDDLRILVDAPEVPALDGSARGFVSLLADAGRVRTPHARDVLRILRSVSVRDGERWMRIDPADRFEIRYTIDFDHPVIGHSERRFSGDARVYAREIAPARTFCRVEDVPGLRRAGLAAGGSYDNAVVVGRDGLVNGPLRFPDEFVRHKILDLLGDLALLGAPVLGRVTAVRAGHALHARLMTALLEERGAWRVEPAVRVPTRVPAVASPAAVAPA